jgi:hypothetical protein
VELAGEGTPHQWLFLALANHELGRREEARAWFERSLLWLAEQEEPGPELTRLRDETGAVLGA